MDAVSKPEYWASLNRNEPKSSRQKHWKPSSAFEAVVELLRIEISKSTPKTLNPVQILKVLYRVVAAEWVTLNRYLDRDLASIEINLEESDPTIEDLWRYERTVSM